MPILSDVAVAKPVAGVSHLAERLSELENEIQLLYENVPFGSHVLDAQGTFLQVNSVELSWLGYSRDDIVGKRKFTDFLTPDSVQLLYRYLASPSQVNEIVALELELLHRDGTFIPVMLNSVGFSDATGQLIKRRGVVFDLRESKLNKVRQMLAAAAFESLSGMFITDSERVILQVNHAFTELTGYSAQEAIGKTPHWLSSGHHDEAFYQAMWSDLNMHGRWEGEIWNKRKDGTLFTEWLSISRVDSGAEGTTHYIGSFIDITAKKTAEAALLQLAYFDPLTQLANRRLLLDRMVHALEASQRSGLHSAILFVDLDHFKAINDTRGHEAGDMVLVEVAQRLRRAVRSGDSVARLGGDEFVVLLEGLDTHAPAAAAQTQGVAEKMNAALAQPYQFNDFEFCCTASIGIEMFKDAVSAQDLLQHADLAMYQSKAAGRNQLRFFDADMQTRVMQRTAMENDLRHALTLGQFKLWYQPQMNVQGHVFAAEALLRWQHPERGLVMPGQFIALAEETGQIIPIGLWALHTACAQLKAWQSMPLARHLRLSVNVSARQYRQDNFEECVRQAISANAIDPGKLMLEVTESMMLDVPDAIGTMNALKALGVSFSMDDFGTGYSSLASLTQLPLSEVKIDQSFVSQLGLRDSDAIIVRTTIAMGQALGLEVIAEGVETQAQRDMLIQMGCERFQGYLFSRPVPIEAFEALLPQMA